MGFSTRGSLNLTLSIRECEMWSDGLKRGICDVSLKVKFFRGASSYYILKKDYEGKHCFVLIIIHSKEHRVIIW